MNRQEAVAKDNSCSCVFVHCFSKFKGVGGRYGLLGGGVINYGLLGGDGLLGGTIIIGLRVIVIN